ncbi:MAG: hypothetical protein VKJ24_15030 [Synechococcales bacterium]|nr:hypothetical protein [Synechococcales bacterium]
MVTSPVGSPTCEPPDLGKVEMEYLNVPSSAIAGTDSSLLLVDNRLCQAVLGSVITTGDCSAQFCILKNIHW